MIFYKFGNKIIIIKRNINEQINLNFRKKCLYIYILKNKFKMIIKKIKILKAIICCNFKH